MAAGVKARERYQITPPSEMPQSAETITTSTHARNLGVTNRVSHSRKVPGARFTPKTNERLELVHHRAECRQGERLSSVADRLLRAGMHFDNQPVRANCNPRPRKRGNQA